MERNHAHRLTVAALLGAAALIVSSCDDGIGLLTTDERQSLYRAEVSARGAPIAATYRTQGLVLDPSEGVRIVFETLKGSEEPSELAVTLRGAPGDFRTAVLYYAGEAPASESSDASIEEKAVSSLASFSQTLAVPSDFPDGYYELSLDARSARGESLSFTLIALFLVRDALPPPAIQVYPANPSPGSRVLLLADLSGWEGRDPYLRWTVEGTVRSEGTVSEGRDRLLWPAPTAGATAPIGLAVYPVAPPPGVVYSLPAPRNATASLLVAPGNSGSADEFADGRNYLALFRMEDSPDYAGRTAGSASFIGSPRLDVHAGGFGLVLGGEEGAGIRAASLLLPIRDASLDPFSLLFRLVPRNNMDGILFRAAAASSGRSLELALSEGRPVLKLRAGERYGEIKAQSVLTAGRAGFLAVSVYPEGTSLRAAFFVDGKDSGGGDLSFGAAGWTGAGETIVAGPGGCPGLYDEAGVWAFDDRGERSIYPAFRFASRREFGASLGLAEGFEGRYEPAPLLSDGAEASAPEGLRLPAGARAGLEAPLEAPFRVEAALASGIGLRLIVTGAEGSGSIPWNVGAGRTDPFSGLILLSATVRPAGEGGGILLSGGDESSVRIPGPGPWKLSLEGPNAGIAVVRYIRAVRTEGIPGE